MLAALGAMLGAWLGWQQAGDLPTIAEATELAGALTPGVPATEFTRRTHLSGSEHTAESGDPSAEIVGGAEEWGAGFVDIPFPQPVTDLVPVRERLRAAGWRTGEVTATELGGAPGSELTAARGDWRMVVVATDRWSSGWARVERAEPPAALVLSLLLAVAGAVLGWFVARRPAGPRWALGAAGLVMLTPATLLAIVNVARDVAGFGGTGPVPLPWEPFGALYFRPLTVLGLALAAVWVTTVLAGRRAAAGAVTTS